MSSSNRCFLKLIHILFYSSSKILVFAEVFLYLYFFSVLLPFLSNLLLKLDQYLKVVKFFWILFLLISVVLIRVLKSIGIPFLYPYNTFVILAKVSTFSYIKLLFKFFDPHLVQFSFYFSVYPFVFITVMKEYQKAGKQSYCVSLVLWLISVFYSNSSFTFE